MCHPEDVSPMVFSFDFFDSEKKNKRFLASLIMTIEIFVSSLGEKLVIFKEFKKER